VDCPSCHQYIDAQIHRCYIQRALTPQEIQEQKKERKRKRQRQRGPPAKRGAAAGLQTLWANEEGDKNEDEEDEKTPPLHVYDGYFVVHQYYADNQKVEQIRNGCKLLQVERNKIIRFIDSLSFFQMPLAAFPKTFGLSELEKGYFPHKFNIPENQAYVGPVPAIDYCMPEVMSPEGRQEFETWQRQQRNSHVVFDFQKELVAYCEQDVRLLKEGCLTFKRLFEAKTRFNPFENMTIASACNRDLRKNRMIPDSLASERPGGWRNRINQSQVALEWLTWCDHQLRQQALEQLTHEDLEAHDQMGRA